ncbi:MAG: hypothetical protein K6G43_02250 [Lachnospiraceae bacterium]|nr:hypothetical protein [Lachnospiraceae bacterium]
MKKRILIILIFITILLGIVGVETFRNVSVIQNCGKDDFSRAIIQTVGDYVVLTAINSDPDKSETQYIFDSRMWSEEQISEFINALNSNNALIEGKAYVELTQGSGIVGPIFRLYNYEEDNNNVTMYDGFCRLYRSSLYIDSDIWGNPILIANVFSGIRQLEMYDDFKTKSDEVGIEWDKVWPELEKIIVYEMNEDGQRTETIIFEK